MLHRKTDCVLNLLRFVHSGDKPQQTLTHKHEDHCMKKIVCLALVASLTGLTGGCTYRPVESYSRYEANQTMNVEYGTVRELRRVNMQGYSDGIGAVTGAVIGGVTGNAVSGRWDKGLGTMLGIIVGGLVGTVAQQNMTQTDGWELIIQLDSGRTAAIAVPATGEQFRIGQRVKLMDNPRGSRVVPSNDSYPAPVSSPSRYPDEQYQPYRAYPDPY